MSFTSRVGWIDIRFFHSLVLGKFPMLRIEYGVPNFGQVLFYQATLPTLETSILRISPHIFGTAHTPWYTEAPITPLIEEFKICSQWPLQAQISNTALPSRCQEDYRD